MVVQSFTEIFGPITEDKIQAAKAVVPAVVTPLDYVISYVVASVWSGATPPLTWQKMLTARKLRDLLPNIPASGEPVLSKVSDYLTALGPTMAFQDQLDLSSWILRQLKANTESPTTANGGMLLVDPASAENLPDPRVRYGISKAIDEIEADLKNTSRRISMTMTTSQFDRSAFGVSVQGSGSIPLVSVLGFVSGSAQGSFSYDMNRVAGASADTTVELTFSGFTLVPAAAAPWQQDTNSGWYYGKPIEEAWRNWQRKGPPSTGFRFISDPQLGSDGTGFGRITGLLVSNYPSIKITYRNADYREFREHWSETVRGNVKLFGFIPIGSASQSSYSSKVEQGGSNSEFSLTFEPTPSTAGPVLERTTYVIGGIFEFPAQQKPEPPYSLLR